MPPDRARGEACLVRAIATVTKHEATRRKESGDVSFRTRLVNRLSRRTHSAAEFEATRSADITKRVTHHGENAEWLTGRQRSG